MTELQLEVMVEEESAHRLLRVLLPKIVPDVPFVVRTFAGKPALLKALPERLRGYARRLVHQPGLRVLVLADRDDADCHALKARMENSIADAGLLSLSSAGERVAIVATRIVIEELEAWFLGDLKALRAVYPRVPANLDRRAAFRDPDAIAGGTWEALERVLQQHGYHSGGLPKIAIAEGIGPHMNIDNNRSHSFAQFRDGVRRLVEAERVA